MGNRTWEPPTGVWRLVRAGVLAGRAPRDMFLGEGAETTPGRWHQLGTRVAYCSVSAATTMLEVMVHASRFRLRQDFVALWARLPPGGENEVLSPAELPEDWNRHPAPPWTREYGSTWAQSNRSLGLAVPSTVVPIEWNVLLNPRHPAIEQLAVERAVRVRFDPRIVAAWNLADL